MVYRDKTYVAFDGDNDIKYFNLMKAWKQSDNTDFNFYDAHELNSARDSSLTESIKNQLRERMNNSKMFILLLGKHTKYLTRFVKWEVEHAKRLKLPIIIVNLNGNRNVDDELMPSWLNDYPCISCCFNEKILQYSMENWEEYHREHLKNHETSNYYWRVNVYKELGL
ncbi:TIR domain-containing protein [Limosilactobacillus mucosae]|uniref:TIR domain-containing protein n=1 Tax=Limosilactobacillus mucosae TaxID=97478 RepID=UPI0022E69440|nr:TIR domain-containing protein [Limosilactobacillus mucosae]